MRKALARIIRTGSGASASRARVYINGIGGDPKPYIEVADAASELFIELFGEDGKATRSITPQNGVANEAIELDMVVYVKD